jgi:hypothetical protein
MPRFIYTQEHVDFLRAGYETMRVEPLTDAFNARFETSKSAKAIGSALKQHGLMTGGRKRRGKGTGIARLYSVVEKQWLVDNLAGKSHVDIAAEFNARFERSITVSQIKSFIANNGLTTGRTGHFEKGQLTWNKGVKGYMGANATSFKKGDVPPNRQPMYTERIGKDGYIEIKIPERNPHTGHSSRYKHKHLWLWEQANGRLPEGHCIIFVDGDYRNFNHANLMLVTRVVLLHMNLHHYKEAPADLKPSIMALAKLEAKAGIRSTGRAPGAGRKKGTRNKS